MHTRDAEDMKAAIDQVESMKDFVVLKSSIVKVKLGRARDSSRFIEEYKKYVESEQLPRYLYLRTGTTDTILIDYDCVTVAAYAVKGIFELPFSDSLYQVSLVSVLYCALY